MIIWEAGQIRMDFRFANRSASRERPEKDNMENVVVSVYFFMRKCCCLLFKVLLGPSRSNDPEFGCRFAKWTHLDPNCQNLLKG